MGFSWIPAKPHEPHLWLDHSLVHTRWRTR